MIKQLLYLSIKTEVNSSGIHQERLQIFKTISSSLISKMSALKKNIEQLFVYYTSQEVRCGRLKTIQVISNTENQLLLAPKVTPRQNTHLVGCGEQPDAVSEE